MLYDDEFTTDGTTCVDAWETDSKDGWEHLQDLLASDEEWAQYLYESFHGQEG